MARIAPLAEPQPLTLMYHRSIMQALKRIGLWLFFSARTSCLELLPSKFLPRSGRVVISPRYLPLTRLARVAPRAPRHVHPPLQTMSTPPQPLQSTPLLSPVEQEVLDEYARLLDNLHTVGLLPSSFLLSHPPSPSSSLPSSLPSFFLSFSLFSFSLLSFSLLLFRFFANRGLCSYRTTYRSSPIPP